MSHFKKKTKCIIYFLYVVFIYEHIKLCDTTFCVSVYAIWL